MARKTYITTEELGKMKDAIIQAVTGLHDESRMINEQRIASIEKAIVKLTEIVTGNGHPEDGLLVKVDRLTQAYKQFTEREKTRSDREWMIIGGILAMIIAQVFQLIIAN